MLSEVQWVKPLVSPRHLATFTKFSNYTNHFTFIAARRSYPRYERVAHLLLQGAGKKRLWLLCGPLELSINSTKAFLDIDKLVEYRPPLKEYEIWTRPRAPQCTLRYSSNIYFISKKDKSVLPEDCDNLPKFRPMHCSLCFTVVRGSHFRCMNDCDAVPQIEGESERIDADGSHSSSNAIKEPFILCETCARSNAHSQNHLRKFQKHCAIQKSAALLQDNQS